MSRRLKLTLVRHKVLQIVRDARRAQRLFDDLESTLPPSSRAPQAPQLMSASADGESAYILEGGLDTGWRLIPGLPRLCGSA